MTLVQSIDSFVRWLNEKVCNQILLKVPDDDRNDSGYDVEFVNPVAYPLYFPGKDRLPPKVQSPFPGIAVQLIEGEDDLLKNNRQLQFRLCIACWNPGTHGEEVLHNKEDKTAIGGYQYYNKNEKSYERNMQGWRDAFNFADIIVREIENTEYIEGHRIIKEKGIKFGVFTEDGNILDYYPYWQKWITVSLESGLSTKIPEKYQELL